MKLEDAHLTLEAILAYDNDAPFSRDPDGDYVLHYAGAQFYARIIGEPWPVVQIFSVVAADLGAIPELLAYINYRCADTPLVKVIHVGNQVLVESEFRAESLSYLLFQNSCQLVARYSDEIGTDLIELFQGTPRWQNGKRPNYKFGFIPE